MPHYIVTMTSPVIEADSPEDAIRYADDHGGNHWEAVEQAPSAKPAIEGPRLDALSYVLDPVNCTEPCDGTGWTGNPGVRCTTHYEPLDSGWHDGVFE